jgi:hypothetical protein
MMTARDRLPNRRASTTFSFECNALRYLATVSFFSDGRLAEIFISNAKAGSHSDLPRRTARLFAQLPYSIPFRSK